MKEFASVDQIVEAARAYWDVPGVAISIVSCGNIVHAKGYGVSALGAQNPVTERTIFAGASITKAFTATAIALAAAEGQLSWDDPIGLYLPYFRLNTTQVGQEILIRDILANRVGLARHDLLWYGAAENQEQVVRRIACLSTETPFRTAFSYNNILYSAAGLALEAASGSAWSDFIRDRLLGPLNMASSNASVEAAQTNADHATPHRRDVNGQIEAVPWRDLQNIAPAGAINTNVVDLANWMLFHIQLHNAGSPSLDEVAIKETHIPQTVVRLEGRTKDLNPTSHSMCYAMGWSQIDYRGLTMLTHDGAIDGFRSRVTLFPERQLGIAILSNLDSTLLPEALRNSISDCLFDLPVRDWNAYFGELNGKPRLSRRVRRVESRPLETYQGVYHNCAYGDAIIIVDGPILRLKWSSFYTRLREVAPDAFAVDELNPLEFTTLFFERYRGTRYQRVLFLGQEFDRTSTVSKPTKARLLRLHKEARAQAFTMPLEELS